MALSSRSPFRASAWLCLLAAAPLDALQHSPRPATRIAAPRCVAAAAAPSAIPWGDLADNALRLTDAQLTRTVVDVCSQGTLCTTLEAAELEGAIFSSCEAYATDAAGHVLISLSSEQAKSNLKARRTASFFVRAASGGAAAGSAVTLIGEVEEMSVDEVSDAVLAKMSAATGHTAEEIGARPWRRLTPSRVHVSDAVRRVEAWVPPTEYAEAASNPLAPAAATLLHKMNGAHAESLKRFAAVYAGLDEAKVSSVELLGVDQLGFDMRVAQGSSSSVMRIGFRQPPANEEEGVSVFMKLFQEAYERQHGWM